MKSKIIISLFALCILGGFFPQGNIGIASAQSSSLPACNSSATPVTVPDINGNAQLTGWDNPGGVSCQPSQQQSQSAASIAQGGQAQPGASCTASVFSWSSFFSPSCWGPLLSGVISGALVYIASSILTIAGTLFNWVLYETVLQFGQLINGGVNGSNTGIITGINTAWSVFRDISNIVIIGMFTFIAIATILGNTEYGYKKMLSRVLIVAVIINFSLLFTKIIIDVSNFTAIQFYNAASTNNPNLQDNNPSQTAQGQTGTATQSGIAGAFMGYAGVQGLGDTATAVFNVSKNPQGGAWWGLLYGVLTALLFLVAAIVLFYGSFLLITRALLMIFLMVTSSIAFATYLIPSLSQGGYGWSMWWQALLKNAVFAPLLMVLLWVTLTIGSGFQASSGTLGSAIANPGAPLGISALFGYIIVIGLLFASFRIASSFATSVSGLSLGQEYWSKFASGAGSLLSGSASGAGSFARRYGWERPAYKKSEKETEIARGAATEASRLRELKDPESLKKAIQKEKESMKAAERAIKFGERGGGYKKKMDEHSKKVSAVLGKAQPSADDRATQAKQADEVRKAATESAGVLEKHLKESRDQTNKIAEAFKQEVDNNNNDAVKNEHAKNLAEATASATEKHEAALKPLETSIRELTVQMSRTGVGTSEHQRLQQDLVKAEAGRKSEMEQQTDRLERARQTAMIKTAGSDAASAKLKELAQQISEKHGIQDEIQASVQHVKEGRDALPTGKDVREAQNATRNSLIQQAAAKQVGIAGRVFGVDNDVAHQVRHHIDEEGKSSRSKKLIETMLKRDEKKAEGEGGGGGDH